MSQCIGYGEHRGACGNEAKAHHPEQTVAFWCERCEKLRRETIDKQLAEITKLFDE